LAFGLTFLAVWLWAQVDFVRPPERYDEPIGALILLVMGALLAFGRKRGYEDLAEMAQRKTRWYSASGALLGLQIKGWVLLLAGLVLSGHWLARTL
jgi:hypothetical protein